MNASIFGILTGVFSLILSAAGLVSMLVSIGRYRGKTDQRLDTLEATSKEQSKKIQSGEDSNKEIQTTLAHFTGEMSATMKYIQSDLKDIKEKVDAKAK